MVNQVLTRNVDIWAKLVDVETLVLPANKIQRFNLMIQRVSIPPSVLVFQCRCAWQDVCACVCVCVVLSFNKQAHVGLFTTSSFDTWTNFVNFSVTLCMPGEQWNGTHCVKCPAQHYKNDSGNLVPCAACPAGEVAPDVGYVECGELEKNTDSGECKIQGAGQDFGPPRTANFSLENQIFVA